MVLVGVLGGAFAAGRSTVARRVTPNPVRLEQGMPVGVLRTPSGALAAADNYVATAISASLDPTELQRFADALIDPSAREQFVSAGQNLAQTGSPPPGARVLGSVVAHRLDSYAGDSAEVSAWLLGSYWGGGLVPSQYSALVQMSLRWMGDRWQIASVRQLVPGPVSGLVAGSQETRSTSAWDAALTGMSGPYYGDG